MLAFIILLTRAGYEGYLMFKTQALGWPLFWFCVFAFAGFRGILREWKRDAAEEF